MKKLGRNDPCHCGSGKKFKKCCESKMLSGRFLATPISEAPGAAMAGRAFNLGALFQARVVQPLSTLPPSDPVTIEVQEEADSIQTLEGKGDILVSS